MKLSQSFIKTFRDVSKDETTLNAKLLIRAGYIHKQMAGVYSFLPLGLLTLENIKSIIREEMNAIGGQELQLTTLQKSDPWEKTGRWSDDVVDIWFKTELSAGGLLGLAPTHEEPLTEMMTKYISSYKDLPVYAYQFQTKFRNELRSKSGILRTREFLMKDLYSFCADEETHNAFYDQVDKAYMRVFERVGLGNCTYKTFASGGVFSKYSHEYQTILPIGEDTIYYNPDKSVVLNEEVLIDEVLDDLGVKREELKSTNAAEVGNIFTLKYKFSEPLDLKYTTKDGESQVVFMGSYGIGVSRLMGVLVEKFADDKGIIWPENIAPFKYYMIAIGDDATKKAEKLHAKHKDLILLDDRNLRPGEKFNDADLTGIPYRVVISDKTLSTGQVEVTKRSNGDTSLLTLDELDSIFNNYEKNR